MNEHGEWCTYPGTFLDIISGYFQIFFSSSSPSSLDMDPILSCVKPRVTGEMNYSLTSPFSSEEVRLALVDMHPTKNSRPNELPALFYQKYWSIVGEDITKTVLNILTNQGNVKFWNKTLITLISKVKDLKTVKDFRPKSLCNVLYKIVSRIITNHFILVLDDVIREP